jgi:hypothetical protein
VTAASRNEITWLETCSEGQIQLSPIGLYCSHSNFCIVVFMINDQQPTLLVGLLSDTTLLCVCVGGGGSVFCNYMRWVFVFSFVDKFFVLLFIFHIFMHRVAGGARDARKI